MNTWHLDDTLTQRYTDGLVAPVLAASVEQHLLACADCRSRLHVEPTRLDAAWAEIIERVEAPRDGLLERGLRRLGASNSTARLVAATPTLRGGWLTGVVVVLTLAMFTAQASPRGIALFVTLAPILPLIGVAYAFGPYGDPMHTITASAPYSSMRLLTIRTSFVVASTLLPASAAALFLPGAEWVSVAWLLPALAMTTLTVAAAGHVPVHVSALSLSGVWAAMAGSQIVFGGSVYLEQPAAIQLVSLVVLALAGASIVTRRNELSEQLRRSA